jgi:hypothetical protein
MAVLSLRPFPLKAIAMFICFLWCTPACASDYDNSLICPPETGIKWDSTSVTPTANNMRVDGIYAAIVDYRLGRVCNVFSIVNGTSLSCASTASLPVTSVTFLRERDCPRYGQ